MRPPNKKKSRRPHQIKDDQNSLKNKIIVLKIVISSYSIQVLYTTQCELLINQVDHFLIQWEAIKFKTSR